MASPWMTLKLSFRSREDAARSACDYLMTKNANRVSITITPEIARLGDFFVDLVIIVWSDDTETLNSLSGQGFT